LTRKKKGVERRGERREEREGGFSVNSALEAPTPPTSTTFKTQDKTKGMKKSSAGTSEAKKKKGRSRCTYMCRCAHI
jgi:hypothetical protein